MHYFNYLPHISSSISSSSARARAGLYCFYGSREITWELTVVLCMGGNADAAGTESAFPLIVFVF